MACTIELRLLNFISEPNFVSIVQHFLEPEDPSRIKFSGASACRLHPAGTVTTKAHTSGRYTCNLQVSHQRYPPFGMWGWEKVNRCKTLARAMHVHTAPQLIKSYGAKQALPRCTHVPSLVSLAQNFFPPEDPKSKNFFAPSACCLHPTATATPKALKLGWYPYDLRVAAPWCPPFDL